MKFLQSAARVIDVFNEYLGVTLSWLTLTMVLVQFLIVVMRYTFGLGSIFMQETIVYMHAFLFMLAVGYTLLHNAHVRVDIFYSTASTRQKAWVDFCGVFLFVLPVATLIWWAAWPYVVASWRVYEGSVEVSGIQGVFILKTVILAFASLMSLQALSMAAHSLLILMGVRQDMEPEVDGAGL